MQTTKVISPGEHSGFSGRAEAARLLTDEEFAGRGGELMNP